ncbi:MAG: hypothetical protein U1E73_01345 [Planctomycetota bacterium]
MLLKSLCVGVAVLASTPLCLMHPQEPAKVAPAAPQSGADTKQDKIMARELARMQRELAAAKKDVEDMRRQLGELLDTVEAGFTVRENGRNQNCSPSRNRALMSHYQWLEKNHHDERATKMLATVVEQVGDNTDRLNAVAWELMTDKESAGKYDRIALALADRMEATGQNMHHRYLDTIALARFLNGQVDRAVELEKTAIERGGNDDDYRRRLRTYEAARDAIAAAQSPKPESAVAGVAVASANDE